MALFGLEEDGLIYSGFLTRDCDFPVLNIQRLFDDQWARNLPTFFGRWRDGTIQRAITSVKPVLTIPGSLAKCDYATIRTDLNGCRWLVPDMESIRFKAEEPMTWDEAIDDFCNSRMMGYRGDEVRASLLGPSGLNFSGSPEIAGPFARFVMAGQAQGLKDHLQSIAMNGVNGNVLEIDGFLTQLTSGWAAADLYSERCEDYNLAVQLNWATLTGGTPGTPVGPDATIDAAHDIITMWGVAIAGFEGLNYAEFCLRFLEIVRDEWAAPFGGVTQWEWILPQGEKRCLRELLACIQPCDGSGVLNDMDLRDRFAEYYRSDLVQIYPDDTPIMMSQTRQLTDTAIFGPRMIGGDYTYGWTFRNMDTAVRQMNTWLRGHGYTTGQEMSHPLVQHNLDNLRANFETLAFLWKLVEDADGRCFTPTIEAWPGMLVYGRHMFLVMSDIVCEPASSLPGSAQDPVIGPVSLTVNDCTDETPVGSEVTRLTLALDAAPATTPTAGDAVIVVGANDVKITFDFVSLTVLDMIVASDVLVTDCATFGPVAVVV